MKKPCIVLLLALVMFLGGVLSGCSGLIDSHADRRRRMKAIWDINMRALVDDVDYLLLIDKPTTLTEYHTDVGM